MYRLVPALATLFAAICFGLPEASAAPRLELTAPTTTPQSGQTLTVELRGEDFGTTSGGLVINNVSGGQQVSVSFSAPALQLVSVAIHPRWNFAAGTNPGTVNNTTGTLTGLAFASFPASTGTTFPVATLTFQVGNSQGPALINVTGAQVVGRVNNVSGTAIATQLGQLALTIDSATGTAEGDVPIPLWALAGLGLGLAWLGSRAR